MIKVAGQEQLTPILALQKLCYQENAARYNDFNIQPLTQTLDDLLAEYAKSTILFYAEGNAIIGSVRGYVEHDTCYIGEFFNALPAQSASHFKIASQNLFLKNCNFQHKRVTDENQT